MQYKATHIASFFLGKANPEDNVTNLKLQKLVYIAFGWHTVYGKHDLYLDRIEAWRYGPVIPSLYYKLNGFENKPIKVQKAGDCLEVIPPDEFTRFPFVDQEDEFTRGFLEVVFDVYVKKPGYELVDLTHGKATPWDKVYVPNANVEIPKSLIKDYYGELAQP